MSDMGIFGNQAGGALRAGSLYGAVTGPSFLPFPKVNAFDEQPDSQ
jgi:hypothetical protein